MVSAAVLKELRLRTVRLDKGLPPAFVQAFDGDGFPGSWFDLFIRHAAHRLATGDFAAVWQVEQAAITKAIGEASLAVLGRLDVRTASMDAKLDRIAGTTRATDAKLDDLMAMLQAAGITDRAAERGISEAAVRAIVDRLGGQGIARRPGAVAGKLDRRRTSRAAPAQQRRRGVAAHR